jgi:glycosyltransferase involved in cell wall biosynthesis
VEQVGNIVPRRTDKKNIQAGYDVVMVCRLEEQKNVVNAVEALIHFSQTNPDRRVAVIGDGSLRLQIEAMLSKSESKVKMLGYVENAAEVIANSSVLFSLSRHEGLPNVVLEALSAETIPVLSCIPEHIEIVGAQYPFLVSLSDSASEAGAAIESAFRDGAINAVKQLEPLIEDLTAEVITRKYAKILSTMKHGGR